MSKLITMPVIALSQKVIGDYYAIIMRLHFYLLVQFSSLNVLKPCLYFVKIFCMTISITSIANKTW